tara:strand:- start:115 stop:1482 length:1368 start_codon:yes stop_codon:yes gene_type:complete
MEKKLLDYDIYFKKFYTELFKFETENKSHLYCKDCKTKKKFIMNEDELVYSCGPLRNKNKECGLQFTIKLPKYVNYRDLENIYNEVINGHFNYEKDNIFEYNLENLSKKMNVDKDLNNQIDSVKRSLKSLEKLRKDYINQNNLLSHNKLIEELYEKRTRLFFEKRKIMNRLLYDESLLEHNKSEYRRQYALLINENRECINLIEKLRKPNSEYIMIEEPEIYIGERPKKEIKVKESSEEKEKILYTYDKQVEILRIFYGHVATEKTKDEVIDIINRRRNKGDKIGTRIPTKPWLELCDKLEKKYKLHPIKYYNSLKYPKAHIPLDLPPSFYENRGPPRIKISETEYLPDLPEKGDESPKFYDDDEIIPTTPREPPSFWEGEDPRKESDEKEEIQKDLNLEKVIENYLQDPGPTLNPGSPGVEGTLTQEDIDDLEKMEKLNENQSPVYERNSFEDD